MSGKEVCWRVGSDRLAFHCPGCGFSHQVVVDGSHAWGWNGSLTVPTITPSVLCEGVRDDMAFRCHSFVTAGRIRFLPDCSHGFAGKTMDLW